jgi:hypothetical protein
MLDSILIPPFDEPAPVLRLCCSRPCLEVEAATEVRGVVGGVGVDIVQAPLTKLIEARPSRPALAFGLGVWRFVGRLGGALPEQAIGFGLALERLADSSVAIILAVPFIAH